MLSTRGTEVRHIRRTVVQRNAAHAFDSEEGSGIGEVRSAGVNCDQDSISTWVRDTNQIASWSCRRLARIDLVYMLSCHFSDLVRQLLRLGLDLERLSLRHHVVVTAALVQLFVSVVQAELAIRVVMLLGSTCLTTVPILGVINIVFEGFGLVFVSNELIIFLVSLLVLFSTLMLRWRRRRILSKHDTLLLKQLDAQLIQGVLPIVST